MGRARFRWPSSSCSGSTEFLFLRARQVTTWLHGDRTACTRKKTTRKAIAGSTVWGLPISRAWRILVLGGAVATGAIVGLLTFPLFIAGIALIGTAIERVEGAADVASWRLLGGLLLILGLFVTMPLAFLSAVTAVRPRAEQMAPTWIEFLALAAAWSLCPGLICAGALAAPATDLADNPFPLADPQCHFSCDRRLELRDASVLAAEPLIRGCANWPD